MAVIVTVPIGCLKAHDIDFKPPLPAWKQEAIDKMGNGNLNKARGLPQAFEVIGSSPVGSWSWYLRGRGCRKNASRPSNDASSMVQRFLSTNSILAP